MTISDFVDKYYLHDSGLNEIIIEPNNSIVRLVVELCNWMQDEYVEGEPEMLPIELTFIGVTETANLERDIDKDCGDEFISADVDSNGAFHAILCTTEGQDTYEIMIHAEEVQVIECLDVEEKVGNADSVLTKKLAEAEADTNVHGPFQTVEAAMDDLNAAD